MTLPLPFCFAGRDGTGTDGRDGQDGRTGTDGRDGPAGKTKRQEASQGAGSPPKAATAGRPAKVAKNY